MSQKHYRISNQTNVVIKRFVMSSRIEKKGANCHVNPATCTAPCCSVAERVENNSSVIDLLRANHIQE